MKGKDWLFSEQQSGLMRYVVGVEQEEEAEMRESKEGRNLPLSNQRYL